MGKYVVHMTEAICCCQRTAGKLLMRKLRKKRHTQHNGHRKQTDREKLTSLVRTAPLTLLDLFSQKTGGREGKEDIPWVRLGLR